MARSLLTIDSNPKTVKGNKRGYQTAILHLAPVTLAGGHTVCPYATKGCAAACLNTAGRGGIPGSIGARIQAARIRKTQFFHSDRAVFMATLAGEVARAIRRANRRGLTPVFRLNGTSDILWERIPVTYNGRTFTSIMAAFPDVRFYDYTKIPARFRVSRLPANYDLTFSLAESNEANAREALTLGLNVAVVFRNRPARFWDVDVIDGDETDLRFLDPRVSIVGLKAKGRAKRDTSGFVRD